MQKRVLVPEWMDDPGLCPAEHARALAGLRRINSWSGTAKHLVREILHIACRDPQSRWRILDLGCANGELVLELAKALEGKLSFHLTGWDMSSVAIEDARSLTVRAESRRGPAFERLPVDFEVRNVFDALGSVQPAHRDTTTGGVPQSVWHEEPHGEGPHGDEVRFGEPSFDIVYCTLFLHHFDDRGAVDVLRAMKRLARAAVIVDDLQRSTWGWWLAYLGCHLLSRSPVVHFDGPQSVRAALTVDEARAIAGRAGLEPVTIRKHWPERYMMRWERTRLDNEHDK